MSGGVAGWIVTDTDGLPVLDDFGAVTSYSDYLSAVAAARNVPSGNGQIRPLLKAKPTDGAPRRGGRRPKQQQEET